MSYKIKAIHAHEILDSRGDPTVNVSVLLSGGTTGTASVPSGASTGTHEALELRDGDKTRYGGKGVLKACAHVNGPIADALRGKDVRKQRDIDQIMCELDGTDNKSKLGANAILGVSLACAHAAAKALRLPLYSYIRHAFRELRYTNYHLPLTFMNFINGGLHADTNLVIQEVLLIPVGTTTVRERIRMGAEVFHALGVLLKKNRMDTDVGNEGGYAPTFKNSEHALQLFTNAIKLAGYIPGKDAMLGIDVAASELFNSKTKQYELKTDRKRLGEKGVVALYGRWMKKYPLASIEDPFAEDEWESWTRFTRLHKNTKVKNQKLFIIGDDLFVTNVERVRKGIAVGAANAVLIKVNQIGTLSETIDTILLAQSHGYRVVVSHRSGETCDTTIADLSVAVNADAIKTGSVARSERVAKYNRLMEIEEELQVQPKGSPDDEE